jgi:hypothetical protein
VFPSTPRYILIRRAELLSGDTVGNFIRQGRRKPGQDIEIAARVYIQEISSVAVNPPSD